MCYIADSRFVTVHASQVFDVVGGDLLRRKVQFSNETHHNQCAFRQGYITQRCALSISPERALFSK